MNDDLKNIILIQKELQNVSIESYGFKGYIETATDNFVSLSKNIKPHIIECYYADSNDDVDFENIQKNKSIYIKINLADIHGYYHTVSEFLKANKVKLKYDTFYIQEIDYLEGETSKNIEVENFKTNICIISFLKDISDYHKNIAGDLELFFYKAERGIALLIEYNWGQIPKDLSKLEGKIKDLKSQLSNFPDAKERKQIFINELIGILKKGNTSYVYLLKNISSLIKSYEKSFDLYLSGFSFDKIKTASIEHFHELTDRIHSTILKYSTYIFAIPVAYIFLIRFLDFSGGSILKDTFLIILGIIFFILVWFVLFKNIDEAISSVENDIISFEDKLGNNEKLVSIKIELEKQKNKILPKQKNKLRLAKILTCIILVLILAAYTCIHYDYFTDKKNNQNAYAQPPYTLPSRSKSQSHNQNLSKSMPLPTLNEKTNKKLKNNEEMKKHESPTKHIHSGG